MPSYSSKIDSLNLFNALFKLSLVNLVNIFPIIFLKYSFSLILLNLIIIIAKDCAIIYEYCGKFVLHK